MPLSKDAILEGATASDIKNMSQIWLSGPADLPVSALQLLAMKGWVDVYFETVLITLTGRILIERNQLEAA